MSFEKLTTLLTMGTRRSQFEEASPDGEHVKNQLEISFGIT